ncbi:Mediator of RNA polymerase II transcription subunit 11 [Linum perenne]
MENQIWRDLAQTNEATPTLYAPIDALNPNSPIVDPIDSVEKLYNRDIPDKPKLYNEGLIHPSFSSEAHQIYGVTVAEHLIAPSSERGEGFVRWLSFFLWVAEDLKNSRRNLLALYLIEDVIFSFLQTIVKVLELAGGVMDELANPMGPRKELINNHCREFMQMIKDIQFTLRNEIKSTCEYRPFEKCDYSSRISNEICFDKLEYVLSSLDGMTEAINQYHSAAAAGTGTGTSTGTDAPSPLSE